MANIIDVSADEEAPRILRREGGWSATKIARLLLIALGGLLLLAGLLVAGLNTVPGRRLVADRVEALEFANGMRIGIGRIDGSLYGLMTIRGLTFSDSKGEFLRVPKARLDWRPLAYLGNHLDIRSLTAPTASLSRIPEFRPTPPSDAPLLPDLDIDVGRLKVDRLIITPAVSGERRVAFIDGKAHIADRRAQVTLDAAVLGFEGRPGGDSLALELDAVPEANRLALNLFVSAPRGGVIATMAGLKAPMTVRIDGRGDWRKWDGRLAANFEDLPFARLSLTARSGTFGVRGPTRMARVAEGPTAALLGPITNVALQSTWENCRAEIAGRIASDAFILVANGVADLGRNVFDDLRLNFGLVKPGAIAPNLAGRNIRASATLDGALARPTIDYRITAASLAFNDIAVQALDARGIARFAKDRIVVPVAARAQAINGLDVAAGGTIRNVRLNGDLSIDWPRVLSDNLRIRSDRIDATAIILADVAKGLYTGAIDGRVNDYRIESVGLFNLDTRADIKTLANGGLSLVGRLSARSTRLFNDGVRNFIGGNLIASSDVAYGRDGIVRFSRLRLRAPKLRVTEGRGSYSPNGGIDLQASAISTDYGPVGLQVAGTIANPRAVITATRPGLGVGIAGLRAEIRGTGDAYLVRAIGRSVYGPFVADVAVRTATGPLTIDVRSATLAGILARGIVRQTPAGPFAGRLDATGPGLGGVVRLAAVGRFQEAVLNLRANDTILPPPANIAVGSAKIDARIILYDHPEIVADVQLARARFGSTDVTAFRGIINYQDGRGVARVLAEGTSGVPFRIAVNGELQPDVWRAALRGRVNGINIQTASPARIVPRGNTYELLPTRLNFDRGNVRLAGSYGRELRLQSRIDGLDLSLIDAFIPGLGVGGRAIGSVDFVRAGSALPQADVRLAIRNFTRTTAASVSRPLDVNLIGELRSNQGNLRAVMRTRGAVVGRIQVFVEPLGPSAGGWTQRISGAPVRGGIRYVGPADALFSLAGLADQSLAGPLGVAADFSCRVSSPCLTGVVRGRGLTYSNATYGTRLTNLSIAGRFTGERLQIDSLTADAGKGTLTGRGYISLAAANGYPANFALNLDNARLADSDALRATASGNVRLIKAANQSPLLTGTVRLPSTRYQIIRQGSARVPELTGVRFKPPRGPLRVTGDASPQSAASGFGDVRLDLRIVAPGELFVSGMGLESEWRADLSVSGTSVAPRVAGTVDLVRGTLGFAGRSFELREGRARFAGGSASDVNLTLRAEETIEDVVVTVNVDGSATNPTISFSSSPGLPQDEIVSRILFGNSVGSLSAIQAVQLAASLNSLRGSGGGLNPLGKLRAATGLDRLRILGADETSGRGTALAAGKYITDDIYIEVVTDARGFTATQLEIALSKGLSILSQAGGSNSTNVNIRYRKTY